MKMEDGRFTVYGNPISESESQKAIKWQKKYLESAPIWWMLP